MEIRRQNTLVRASYMIPMFRLFALIAPKPLTAQITFWFDFFYSARQMTADNVEEAYVRGIRVFDHLRYVAVALHAIIHYSRRSSSVCFVMGKCILPQTV